MHKHHIVPKHRDPTSTTTVEVTVTQHAMFHYCEWKLNGHKSDWLAWRGLSGLIGKDEIMLEVGRLAASRGLATRLRNGPSEKLKQHCRRLQPKAIQAALSPEARSKKAETMRVNKHAQGHRNSQYGTMWVTNEVESKKIRKGDSIPSGWRPGRKM